MESSAVQQALRAMATTAVVEGVSSHRGPRGRSGEPSSLASADDDRSDGEEIQGGGFGGFWWVAGLGGNDGLQR
ncbi:hypothetical protein [Oryza sativa Japonica Group]|uniref:Uncharacterized protein n=1 Tax=Oryza sativa subsp. japonica TaxID=39947 RepID=Q5JK81_ORYSJ|nr:hypothetical protein [Oryza sativa Japonica Group]